MVSRTRVVASAQGSLARGHLRRDRAAVRRARVGRTARVSGLLFRAGAAFPAAAGVLRTLVSDAHRGKHDRNVLIVSCET